MRERGLGKLDGAAAMTRVALIGPRLARDLAIRGVTQTALAQAAHVSMPTLAAALAGKPLNIASATRIARAVKEYRVITELDDLIAPAA
jgi:transcriptional regulator with XRE-family HTH domain